MPIILGNVNQNGGGILKKYTLETLPLRQHILEIKRSGQTFGQK